MDRYRQTFQTLQARYQLKWPDSLSDEFLGLMESNLSPEQFGKAAAQCLRKNNFFPSFDWFIEQIKGTQEQQAQQKLLAQSSKPIPAPDDSLPWHIERLKAKVAVGRSLGSPPLIEAAKGEALDRGLPLSAIGITENEEYVEITENEEYVEIAKANADARRPDKIQSGNVTLHRIGALTKSAARGLLDAS